MKLLKSNSGKGDFVATERRLIISLLIAAVFFFSGCVKDTPLSNEKIFNSKGFSLVNTAVTQTGTLEAEQAVLSGAVVSTNQTGYTGSGFADFVHASGDFVEWKVNATA